jgi:hypothetical protein
MADHSGVIGQIAKFMRLDQKFLHALICVSGMILMDGARGTFDPVFAEGVCAPERIGL